MKHSFIYLYLLLVLVATGCKKVYDEELAARNGSSGVMKVVTSRASDEAMRGERVTVYAKVGIPDAAIKIFVGNAEAQILAHGQEIVELLLSGSSNDKGKALADTFSIVIPEESEIGATNVYITVNGARTGSIAFNVKKPDILIPGKVTVAPLISTPFTGDFKEVKDGAPGTATIYHVNDMGMDKKGTIYFIDEGRFLFHPEFNTYEPLTKCIRKIENGVITTIGGNGDDEYANNMTDLKLKDINAMKVAEDGTIYLSVFSLVYFKLTIPGTTDELDWGSSFNRILKINPHTGAVTTLIGRNDKFSWDLYTQEVIVDGPANKAMIGKVRSMELDKEGNLYFLDDGYYSTTGAVLRKYAPADGTVTTLAGILEDAREVTFHDIDGTNPEVYRACMVTGATMSDGFGTRAGISQAAGLVMAGNGRLYIAQGSGGTIMKECVREYNPATKELNTIIGKPANAVNNSIYSGTFKEVDMRWITSFDADFDGNILVGYVQPWSNDEAEVYKIDLTKEMVFKIAGKGTGNANEPQPGATARLGNVSRILFDQFGKLYLGYYYFPQFSDIRFTTITIER